MKYYIYSIDKMNENVIDFNIINSKDRVIKVLMLFLIFCNIYFFSSLYYEVDNNHRNLFKRFINQCKKLRKFNSSFKKLEQFPFFSVCISAYNAEKYIERSILSILNQSFKNAEIIIVNDKSSDDSENIIISK